MDTYEEKGSELIPIKELDLFYTPPTEGAIQRRQWVQYRPTSAITEGSPLEFIVPGSGSQYLDLKHTYLHVKMRIIKTDGTVTGATAKVAPVNMTLHSLFSQVDMFLNQKLTSSVGVNYPYKAMIDALLSSSSEAALSRLQAEGFYMDLAGFMDVSDPLTGANQGLSTRFALTTNSAVIEFRGPLALDISQQSRLIINEVEMKLSLWPSKDMFVLMADGDDTPFKVQIMDAVLFACKVNVNPSIIAAHTEALQMSPALYPYERSQIKTFEVSSGKAGFDIENIFLGDIPRLLVVAMVDSSAYRGDKHKNPFNFKNNKLNWLSVKVDDESHPFQAVRPTFRPVAAADMYTQLYRNVLDSLDNENGDSWLVNLHQYGRGYTLLVYELLPRDDANHLPLIRRGNLKIQATFSDNLTENITVLCYGKFPNVLKIDSSRDVIV